MRTIRFGRTGESVSAVGLGTWPHSGPKKVGKLAVGWSGHDDELARQALVAAHRGGVTHWDTADVYGDGHAEELIGSVWSEVPRDQIFLASKVGWDPGGYGHYYHPDLVRAHLERSLQKLGTDHLDLYYLHHCDFGENDRYLDGALEVIVQAKTAGKIRFVGLSDWSSKKVLRLAPRVDPDAVQVYRNVIDDPYASSGLKRFVEERDLGAVFFSPLKHGLLLGKYLEPPEFGEGDMRRRIPEFRNQDVLDRLRRHRGEIERRFANHPHPVLEALTAVLLSDSETGTVLVGQRDADQARAAATLGGRMAPEDARWLRDLFSDVVERSKP